MLDARRRIGCQNQRTGVHLRRGCRRKPRDLGGRPQGPVSRGDRNSSAADVVRAVKGLPNYKAGPNIVKNEGERLASGATAEVWKFYLPAITTFCVKVWNACWQRKKVSPTLKTSEIAFLSKAKKDAADPVNGWRTISLLAHGGKAMMRCIWRQILPKVAPNISEAQFGGVPGKGTREAVLVATEIIARFHKATKGSGKCRRPPMYLAAILFEHRWQVWTCTLRRCTKARITRSGTEVGRSSVKF